MGCCQSLISCHDFPIITDQMTAEYDQFLNKQLSRTRYMLFGCLNCLEARTACYRTSEKNPAGSKDRLTSRKQIVM